MKNPLLIWSSILVGLQILAGGAALTDVAGAQAAGIFVLVVGALQAGTAFYTANQTTDTSKVAAVADNGQLVAGPAAAVENGKPVDVIPTVGDPFNDIHG